MKITLITGGTDGVGKLTTLKLAKDGHQILLHGRNSEKLKNTISEIKEKTANDKISSFVSDLADFSSIQEMLVKYQMNFYHLIF